jgi:hypothetical protein
LCCPGFCETPSRSVGDWDRSRRQNDGGYRHGKLHLQGAARDELDFVAGLTRSTSWDWMVTAYVQCSFFLGRVKVQRHTLSRRPPNVEIDVGLLMPLGMLLPPQLEQQPIHLRWHQLRALDFCMTARTR